MNNDLSSLATTDSLYEIMSGVLMCDTPDVVQAALLDLHTLLTETHAGAQHDLTSAACELDTPLAVVMCLKKWLHNEAIQEWGLLCLHQLALADEDARPAIVSSGGVEAIVCSMKLYPNAADIQRSGCLALGSVLTPPLCFLAKSLATRFACDWNGVSLALDAMEQWPTDTAMQEAAIGLLCSLTSSREARKKMMDSDAANKVGMAMENHPSNEYINSHGSPFMNSMLKTMLFSRKTRDSVGGRKPRPLKKRQSSKRVIRTLTKRGSVSLKKGWGVSVEC